MERFKSFIREDENKEKPKVKKPGLLKKVGSAVKKIAAATAASNASIKNAQNSNRVGGQSTVQRHQSSVAQAMSSDHADAQRADKITRRQWAQDTVRREEVELDEGILKSYHAISKQPWSKTVKDSKGTAGEYKQIGKGKDFTVWYAYRGSNKSFPHYVVKDDKIIGSGMSIKSALKDAGLKDKDLTQRSKFADGSPLNKGMKEDLDEAQGTAAKYSDKTGMFGGKYTSKDHMIGMKNFQKIRSKRQAQKKAAHDKQDPKMSKMGYAQHMVDTEKAKKKAAEKGVPAQFSRGEYKTKNGIREDLDEGILGATAGGAAGFAVGGPIGALTGAGLGHEFEKGARKGYKKVRRKKIDEISKEKLADYATKAIQDRNAARLTRDKYKSSADANRFRGNDDAAKADDKRASDAQARIDRRDRGGKLYTRKMLTKEN